MLIKNCESLDLSNLLHTALENIDYPSKQIHNYVFLIEEALLLLAFLAKMDEAVTFFPKMLAAKKGKWLQNTVK